MTTRAEANKMLLQQGRDQAVLWTSRILLLLGGLWLILTEFTNPGFYQSVIGYVYLSLYVWIGATTLIKKTHTNVRFWTVMFSLFALWQLGLCYLGPNPGSSLWGVIMVVLVAINWGLVACLYVIAALVVSWVATAFGWTHGILPPQDSALLNDPHHKLFWIRSGIASLTGVCIMLISVILTIRQLKQLVWQAADSADQHQESEEKIRQLVEAINQVFWVADSTSKRFIYVSPNFSKIWGRPNGPVETSYSDWLNSIHPSDRERMADSFSKLAVEGLRDETFRIIRADGAVRWLCARTFPIFDLSGNTTRIAGIAEDITERKELEAQLLYSQRMEAVGTLASGIAHDLNNILSPIAMLAGMLRETTTSESTRNSLKILETSAMRGSGIVRQLMTLGKESTVVTGPVVIGTIVQEVIQLIRGTFPAVIKIDARIDHNLLPIQADSNQLHQVLVNICINARDAMPKGGSLIIRAENRHSGDNDTTAPFPPESPSYVVITITDTGEGIPPEVMPRIFDPFFTTKESGKGTGLGLSSAHNIIGKHGGFIRVRSEVGKGTTFSIFLPSKKCAAPAPVLAGQHS